MLDLASALPWTEQIERTGQLQQLHRKSACLRSLRKDVPLHDLLPVYFLKKFIFDGKITKQHVTGIKWSDQLHLLGKQSDHVTSSHCRVDAGCDTSLDHRPSRHCPINIATEHHVNAFLLMILSPCPDAISWPPFACPLQNANIYTSNAINMSTGTLYGHFHRRPRNRQPADPTHGLRSSQRSA